ncbi:MAG: GNAT family N-acyltransferase [Acidobacteriota bacterium]
MSPEHSIVLQTNELLTLTPGPPQIAISEDRYVVRFAQTPAELDAVLKLRFEVFNLELQEGLDASFQTGRDRDEFDATCHHLMLIDQETNTVVGTYRLHTSEIARLGFYSAGEFDLTHLPVEVLNQSVELGRACIADAHRSQKALFLLWKGLVAYMRLYRKRYLFGCCSLTSLDPSEGKAVMQLLAEGCHFHEEFHVPPQKDFVCFDEGFVAQPRATAKIPKLFRTYLRYGAKVCGEPAIDRLFKTIDFFVIFDLAALDALSRVFFGV